MQLKRGLIAYVLLLIASGCSGAAAGDGSSSQALASARLGDASEFEKGALADLVVTQAEYEQAVFATLDCIRERFPELEIEGPYTRPDGFTLGFDFVAHTGNDPSAIEEFSLLVEEADECEEFRASIESVWVEQHIPSGAERQEMRQGFVDCAERIGLEGIDSGMDYSAVLDAVAEHNNRTQDGLAYDCLYEFEVAFYEPFKPAS